MAPLRVAILGCGGFAREVCWALESARTYPGGERVEVVGFVDRTEQPSGLYGKPVWTLDQVDRDVRLLCGIGGMPEIKQRVVEDALRRGFRFTPPLVAGGVAIGPNVEIGEGTIVCAGNILTVDIKIGRHVAVNLACTIGHDCVIEDYCTLSPGVNVSGHVSLERGAYLGTGAALIEGLRIGAYSVVAAGGVVTRDVPERALVAGVPAIVKKPRRELACPVAEAA
jgi:sugar O-acyltransferase (sialic acid O-acetyltransferase NeuD family)